MYGRRLHEKNETYGHYNHARNQTADRKMMFTVFFRGR
jgi:hypothetical protein